MKIGRKHTVLTIIIGLLWIGMVPIVASGDDDDGYNFDSREDPIKPRQDYPKLPQQPGKPRYQLDWFPVYTDIAEAGDMGFNTGPYTVLDTKGENPTSHGYFFSTWVIHLGNTT